jgi:hypothetical protein
MRSAKKLGCAPEIGALVLVALVSARLVVAGIAGAVEPGMNPPTTSTPQKTLSDYFTDLGSDDGPQRLFAARAVKAETMAALRAAEKQPADSLVSLDARSVLVEVDARLPGACRAALRYENTAVLCAELLAATGHAEMFEAVQAARPLVKGKGALRRFDAAVVALAPSVPADAAAPQADAAAPAPADAPAPPAAPSEPAAPAPATAPTPP